MFASLNAAIRVNKIIFTNIFAHLKIRRNLEI